MNKDDIMRALYFRKEAYFVDMFGKVKSNITTLYNDRNNCTSQKHIEKWLAINDMLNVAYYLNQSWYPDWENTNQEKYTIVLKNGKFEVQQIDIPSSIVYFASPKLAEQAIEILGEESLKIIFL